MKLRIVPTSREFFDDFLAARNLSSVWIGSTTFWRTHPKLPSACRGEGGRARRRIHPRILTRLDSTFVTPFDPEDIQRLAQGIDDVVDDIYHVSEMVVLTNITDLIPEVKEQVEVLA